LAFLLKEKTVQQVEKIERPVPRSLLLMEEGIKEMSESEGDQF
jgi:hypothetical protein